MTFSPFTLEEATDVCDDFEDLIDTEFKDGQKKVWLINDVIICPFEENARTTFVASYLTEKKAAVEHDTVAGYDVILYISDADDEAVFNFTDIRTFAIERGIVYHFPAAD